MMSVAATAMLVYTIDKAYQKNKKLKLCYPDSKHTFAIMKQIGIFKQLRKKPKRDIDILRYPDIKDWYSVDGSGLMQPKEYTPIVEKVIEKFNLSTNNTQIKRILGESIGELVLNISEHAYEPDTNSKYWVLFATYMPDIDSLCLVIADRGRGIPLTFSEYHELSSNWFKHLNLLTNKDSGYIKESIEDSFKLSKTPYYNKLTKTTAAGRGTGLKTIKNNIDSSSGYLSIYSQRGYYSTKQDASQTFSNNINGTIIECVVPVEVLAK